MQGTKLNLTALRSPHPTQTLPEGSKGESGTSFSVNGFSRRDLLKMTGIAAIGSSPTVGVLGATLQGPFEFKVNDGRAAFSFGGRERWVIDTKRFGGKPVLKTARDDRLIRVELTNAKYPGTGISADLFCEIHRQLSGWQMKLSLTLGEFVSEVPFEDWLVGHKAAVSGVTLDNHISEPAGIRDLLIKGTAQAEFSPNWIWRFAGNSICRMSGFGEAVLSDFLALSLLDPAEPGLTSQPAAKRTLVSLKRGQRSWPLEPSLALADGWKILTTDHSFDAFHLETGEANDGRRAGCAFLAESDGDLPTMAFQPSERLTDSHGDQFFLPLRIARYAIVLDAGTEQTALVARFAEEPVWLQHHGVGVQLGDTAETTHFELVCLNGNPASLHCSPAVLGFASSLPDAIVEHASAARRGHLLFRFGATPARKSIPEQNIPAPGLLRINARNPEDPDITLSQPLDDEKIEVLRPDDLLVLIFEFVNLSVVDSVGPNEKNIGPMVQKTDANQPAFIIVRFPPQHILEEAFSESHLVKDASGGRRSLPAFVKAHFQQSSNFPGFPVRSRISGESRLVFRLPQTTAQIPYTLKSLLDWENFEPELVPHALPPPSPEGQAIVPSFPSGKPPSPKENNRVTFIEAPAKLWLTPHAGGAWAHARDAVTHNNRTELWHTRLGVKGSDGHPEVGQDDLVDESNDYFRTLRAYFAEDDDPFLVSLSGKKRKELAQLTSDFGTPGCDQRIIRAERVMLTSLGAWMNVLYAAEPPEGFTLEEWRHRMTMGREHYVRVVTKGYLFPFGHRASRVTITERKFRFIPSAKDDDTQTGQVGAFLVQRTFVIVRQPLKTYAESELKASDTANGGGFGDPSMTFTGSERIYRMLPFKSVRLTTLITPNLVNPTAEDLMKTLDGQPFLFHLIAEDKEGHSIDFTAPLIFVTAASEESGASPSQSLESAGAFSASAMKQVAEVYAKQDSALRQRPLQGQRITFAPTVNTPGGIPQNATSFETETIIFDAFASESAKDFKADLPAFVPVMAKSVIRVQAIEQLGSNSEKPGVRFHQAYLVNEFNGNNRGEVFFELTGSPIALNFNGKADKAGGLATPNIGINGLSRKFGAVGDANNLASGKFHPNNFFNVSAKILGGLTLQEIIQDVTLDPSNDDPSQDGKIPRIANTIERDSNGVPVKNITELSWAPAVQPDPQKLFDPRPGASLSVSSKIITPPSGNEPPYSVNGRLENFNLNFFNLLVVHFDKLELTMQSGKKLDVNAALSDDAVTFGGPLAFLNVLAAVVPSAGFSDPPSLDVTANGVSVGYSIGLPAISAGAWGIRDLSIGAVLTIPFTGTNSTSLRFNFSERHNPFQVSAYGVTGGASLAISVGLGGVEVVEAAVELGGSLALNLGVASGAVFVMIGIHLTMINTKPQNQVSLGGYVRVGGAVSVLGLITVSVEFYMELAYLFDKNRVRGEASLMVKVKVLFFSKKVTLTVVRELDAPVKPPLNPLGPQGARLLRPPSTMDAHLVNEQAWAVYCDAFA